MKRSGTNYFKPVKMRAARLPAGLVMEGLVAGGATPGLRPARIGRAILTGVTAPAPAAVEAAGVVAAAVAAGDAVTGVLAPPPAAGFVADGG